MSDLKRKWSKQLSTRKQYQWKKRKVDFNEIDRRDIIGTEDFGKSFDIAYDRKGSTFRDTGLAYRINPLTGEKEMFVAGSQGLVDWVFNFSNAVSYGFEKSFGPYLDYQWKRRRIPFRRPRLDAINRDRYRQQHGIARMAKKHNVDVMYGHSRAGALVADSPFDGEKYGLDAAMILAKNTGMKNYRRPGVFDAILGISGTKNEVVDSGRSIHWAYGLS